MIAPRFRMVLRDLWDNWERAMLVVAAIAVGVFAVGSLFTGYAILMREIGSGYAATHPATVRLSTEKVDDSLRSAIASQPGVRAVEMRRTSSASVLSAQKRWEALSLTTPADFAAIRLDRFGPDGGTWPPGPGEILIERSSSPVLKAAIGSLVLVKTPSGKLRQLRVAGTVHDSGVTPGWMSRVVYGYISAETRTLLGEDRAFDEVKVEASVGGVGESSARATGARLRALLERNGRDVGRVDVPIPGEHPNMGAMRLILNMMMAFAVLALLLSGLLVLNLVSGIIARQTRQIGVMKAIGATTRQVLGVYVVMVAGLGVLSAIIAMPVAWLAGRGFAGFVLDVFNFEMVRSDCPPWVFVAEMAVGVLVPVVAAIVPAYLGSSTTVLGALRDAGSSENRGAGDRVGALLTRVRWLSRPLALSLRNTFRRRGRLVMTLVALSLGGAVFMTALNVAASLNATIGRSYDQRHYDLELRLARPYPRDAVDRVVRATEGVARAESWLQTPASVVRADGTLGNEVALVGVDPQTSLIAPPMSAGDWLAPGDEGVLVVTPTLAEKEPQLRPGSRVALRTGSRESTWVVKGTAREVGSGMVAYAPYDSVALAARATGLANDLRVVTTTADATSVAAYERVLERRLGDAGMQVVWAQSVASSKTVLVNHVAITLTFLLVVSVLASVVGAMGLTSTMSISVLERTREIGVMRAVGATTHDVLRIVLVEGLLISLVSWIAAIVLSIPLTRLTSTIPAQVFIRAPLDQVVSVPGVWLWLGIVCLVGAIASFIPAWRAGRAPVPETLAYE